MAWRNIRRNPRRTILTMLAIAFACVLLIFMLSLQIGTYEVMIDTSVKTRTGHIQILKQGYNTEHKIRQAIKEPFDIARKIDQIPHITAVAFRSNAFALLSSTLRTSGGFITGIDPKKEIKISNVPMTIRNGRYLNASDTNAAIVGALLAKNLKIDIGDELVVLGSAMDGSVAATMLRVTGIFSSGMDEYDRSAVQIPLSHFQEIFSMAGAVHEIIITCDSLWHVSRIKTLIAKDLSQPGTQPGLVCMSWDELTPGLVQSIQMDLGGGLIFYAVLLVMVAFSIMNTFVMAVFERTKELGTLMAIGAGPWRLSRILILESGFLTLCGILLGTLAGCILTLWLGHIGISMGEAEGMMRQYGIPGLLRPKLNLITAFAGPTAVFLITIPTALHPAFKVHGIRPVEAIRNV